MTNLYAWDLSPYLTDGAWHSLLPGLSQKRQKRALSCRYEADSARIAAAGQLLRHALIQAGVPPEEQIFTENAWGKPALLDRSAPCFSLSHSGQWILCAVGDAPLGVDIELPRCTMAMAQRFFHPQEVLAVKAMPQPEQAGALCRLWVAKEAFLKAEGVGFHRPLNSFCVRLAAEGASLEGAPSLLLHEYRLGAYFACLCAYAERPDLRVVTLP